MSRNNKLREKQRRWRPLGHFEMLASGGWPEFFFEPSYPSIWNENWLYGWSAIEHLLTGRDAVPSYRNYIATIMVFSVISGLIAWSSSFCPWAIYSMPR